MLFYLLYYISPWYDVIILEKAPRPSPKHKKGNTKMDVEMKKINNEMWNWNYFVADLNIKAIITFLMITQYYYLKLSWQAFISLFYYDLFIRDVFTLKMARVVNINLHKQFKNYIFIYRDTQHICLPNRLWFLRKLPNYIMI